MTVYLPRDRGTCGACCTGCNGTGIKELPFEVCKSCGNETVHFTKKQKAFMRRIAK